MATPEPDFVELARELDAQGLHNEAAKACRIGLLGDPKRIDARLLLGRALLSLGRHEEVLGEMRVALDLDERCAPAWLLRAEALALRGDYALSEESLLRARDLGPDGGRAEQMLADIRTALAAGLEGGPPDPTDTREYPATAGAKGDHSSGDLLGALGFGTGEPSPGGPAAPPAARDATGGGDFGDESTLVNPGGPGPSSEPAIAPPSFPAEDSSTAEVVSPLGGLAAPASSAHEPERDHTTRGLAPGPLPPLRGIFQDEDSTTEEVAHLLLATPRRSPVDERGDRTAQTLLTPLLAREDDRGERAPDEPRHDDLPTREVKLPDELPAPATARPTEDPAIRRRARPTAQGMPSIGGGAPSPPPVPRGRTGEIPEGDDEDLDALEEEEAEDGIEEGTWSEVELVDGARAPRSPAPPAATPATLPVAAEPPAAERRHRRGVNTARGIVSAAAPPPEPLPAPRSADEETGRALAPPAGAPSERARAQEEPDDETRETQPIPRPPPEPAPPTPAAEPIARATAPRAPAAIAAPSPPRPAPPRSAPDDVSDEEEDEDDLDPTSQRRLPEYDRISALPIGNLPPNRHQEETAATPLPRIRPKPARRLQRHLPQGMQTLPSRTLLLVGGAAAAVLAIAAITGLALRGYRIAARVERHREAARQRMSAGTWAGSLAAAEEYRRILLDRPGDDPARAGRARALAEAAFEFGDPVEPASLAVAALGDDDSEDAELSRIALALARWDLPRARRLAGEADRARGSGWARYLAGRAELALERTDEAVRLITSAVDREPTDPRLLHGLGIAEAARRHDNAALAAYRRALSLSPNHVSSLIDRAALQIRRGEDLATAESYLEGVVTKLAGEASPAELGRAYLGLGELKLARGDLDGGRAMLMRASARRTADSDASKTGRGAPTGGDALAEELAAAHLKAFELDAAEREAKRAIGTPRGRIAGYLVLAQLALLRGHPDDALHELDQAATSRPDALLTRGRARLALRRYAEAGADFDEAARLAPDLVEARVLRCRVDLALGHPAQAQRELERLERARVAPAQTAEALGLAFLAQRQPDRARYWLARAVERNPLALDARLELARLNLDEGRVEEARADLQHAVQANAEFLPAWRELAGLSLDSADYAAARDEYDTLLAKDPEDPVALLGSVRARIALGDTGPAEERLARAERLGADVEEVDVLRARLRMHAGHPSEAAALLQPLIASAHRPETVALYLRALCEQERREGRPGLAPQAIARAVPVRLRGAAEVQVATAWAYAEGARSSAAEAIARGVLGRAARGHLPATLLADAWTVLGRALYDQGAGRDAARALDNALRLDGRNPRAAYQLGVLLDEQGRRIEARKLLDQAVALDPSSPDPYYELGRLRVQLGDPSAAQAFDSYLRLDPRGPYAEDARRGLRQLTPRR